MKVSLVKFRALGAGLITALAIVVLPGTAFADSTGYQKCSFNWFSWSNVKINYGVSGNLRNITSISWTGDDAIVTMDYQLYGNGSAKGPLHSGIPISGLKTGTLNTAPSGLYGIGRQSVDVSLYRISAAGAKCTTTINL